MPVASCQPHYQAKLHVGSCLVKLPDKVACCKLPGQVGKLQVVRSIPWDLRHAEQLLFLCPCSNLTVYRRSFFAQPLCASLSCLQYGISFGNKKPHNVDGDYIVLLSNLIEEDTVQCIVE